MTANHGSSATAEETREIVASRVFDAPRDLVWRMWTEPEHVKHWWGPRGFTNTIHEMDVRPGGVWRFVMHGPDGTDYDNEITFNEVVKPELLAYSHGPVPRFDVTVKFVDLGEKTELQMRMVFENAAIRKMVAEEYGAVEGLHETMERLGEQLANRNAFEISRTFDAPRDLMFRVWTERDHLQQWFGPKGTSIFHCTNDLRRGGMMHYGMHTPDGGEIWGRWIYREITPPRRLVFVVSFSDPQGGVTGTPFGGEWPRETLSTITFDAEGDRTKVTVQWSAINATEAERKAFADGHASMRGGWTGTFERLGDYLAEVRS